MFFVLSTGRSGSTTIARSLSLLKGVVCLHEPEPQLIEEAKEYVEGKMSSKAIVKLLHETRLSKQPNVIYGESNYVLAFMVDALCKAFPDAHYIWLVRNGLKVVSSLDHRRAYRGTESIRGRSLPSGDTVGDMCASDWHELSPFARCCWRWDWTNRKIRQTLEHTGVKRIFVRLEDLQRRLNDIATFLGVDNFEEIRVPTTNFSKQPVTGSGYWDFEQRKSFVKICGPLMNELYPDWAETFVFNPAQKLRNEALSFLSYRRRTGRVLRHLAKVLVPQSAQDSLAKALSGRGILNYPNK